MDLNLTALFQGYERSYKSLTKELDKLQEEAETIDGQLEARKASQERIQDSQRTIAALRSERSDLLGRWAEVDFEDDQVEKKEIKRRRREIDDEIARLEEEVYAERIVLDSHEVDSEHAASIAVRRDMLKPIRVADFIKKLEELLKADAKELNKRIGRIHVDSFAYSRDEYDRIRGSKDMNYAIQQGQHRRLAVEEEEKRKKMRPVSSTDEMHTIQSSKRKPDDRMSVVASGERVKTYTQRTTEEADERTHVLSGDEIRAALAAKK
jgi:hypothetical protein